LIELGKHIFGDYIRYFTSYETLYGAVSFIPALLIWVYFSWIIILGGACLTYILQNPAIEEKNKPTL
jgi:membrane protein